MAGAAAAGGFALILQRCVILLALAASLLTAQPARALEAVNVRVDAAAIDITAATDLQKTDADRIQVSTAPGPDGIVRRIEVRAREANTNWAVFALTNNSDEQLDRLIVLTHRTVARRRRDGGDARQSQIGPEQAGADHAVMRHDDEAI